MRRSVSNSPNTLLDIQRALQAKRLAEVLAADETESETQQQESVTTNLDKNLIFYSKIIYTLLANWIQILLSPKDQYQHDLLSTHCFSTTETFAHGVAISI